MGKPGEPNLFWTGTGFVIVGPLAIEAEQVTVAGMPLANLVASRFGKHGQEVSLPRVRVTFERDDDG